MRYLSFSQLQLKLGARSKSAVYRDVRLGRLPAPLKIGGKLYWIEDEVDSAVHEQRVCGMPKADIKSEQADD
ncbi:transcriptional regulator [Psychromarinibacter sp. C21-152]|uniref:Transcriptional regulator n=1 Tax=Psychromarinibacter sediminicola TaxID=3033385 RepID=A0AAE3NW72_9RHOB|nr:transcriptional regulator [Psychromarinibacter sediminicola]MDF0603364.1 transcriptional regulator [Psychromarinibacter sediminicola]